MVVGAQQKGDAAHRVEAQQHGGVLEDKKQTRAAQEQEPQRHDGAEGVTDLGRTDALHQKERDDDGERNGDDAAWSSPSTAWTAGWCAGPRWPW